MKAIYVGAKNPKEFHSIKRQKPECNVRKISNPTYFRRGRDAREAGFDPCGHCTRYWKSRRNRR